MLEALSGKVDPEDLNKDFDLEREKHNPGAFLWQDVIGASSMKEALAPVECPYPGYKHELISLQKYLQMAKEEVLSERILLGLFNR